MYANSNFTDCLTATVQDDYTKVMFSTVRYQAPPAPLIITLAIHK